MNSIPVTTTPEGNSQPVAITPAVAKSIARPDAFAKAGTMAKSSAPAKPAGVRFRAIKYQRGPGRPRKNPRDVRDVLYY